MKMRQLKITPKTNKENTYRAFKINEENSTNKRNIKAKL